MLAANPAVFRFQPVKEAGEGRKAFVDLLHANSLEWMHQPHLEARHPLYGPQNVLASFRYQGTIAIFDWQAIRSRGQSRDDRAHQALPG